MFDCLNICGQGEVSCRDCVAVVVYSSVVQGCDDAGLGGRLCVSLPINFLFLSRQLSQILRFIRLISVLIVGSYWYLLSLYTYT
jgi:hypothetical protein